MRTNRWTDGTTDMTKLMVDFFNFAKAPIKIKPYYLIGEPEYDLLMLKYFVLKTIYFRYIHYITTQQ